MKEFLLNNNNILQFPTDNDVEIYFSTKKDGISKNEFEGLNLALHVGDNYDDVIKNRNIYFKKLNTSNPIFCHQTHSDNIKEVTSKDINRGMLDFEDGISNCDAIYTFEKDLCLNTFFADCTPIYLYDTTTTLTCVIHSGWQGTVKQIVKKTILHLKANHGIDPLNLVAIIGPSISFDNFEVESDVVELVQQMDDFTGCIKVKNDSKFLVDVKKLNYLQLKNLNVGTIYTSEFDTYSNNLFYSFRKENKCGRMMASIIRRS